MNFNQNLHHNNCLCPQCSTMNPSNYPQPGQLTPYFGSPQQPNMPPQAYNQQFYNQLYNNPYMQQLFWIQQQTFNSQYQQQTQYMNNPSSLDNQLQMIQQHQSLQNSPQRHPQNNGKSQRLQSNEKRRHKARSQISNDYMETIQTKQWISCTVYFGSSGKPISQKLNCFGLLNTTFREIKIDILQQLLNMMFIQHHEFADYQKYSKIQFQEKTIESDQTLASVLNLKESFTGQVQIPIDINIILIKCKLKITKRGYWTFPKYHDLSTSSDEYLQQVSNFQIGNEHGTIFWPDDIDIRYIDFDEVLEILPFEIEIYKDTPQVQRPNVGDKLNKKCYVEFKITYQSLRQRGCNTIEEMEIYLIKMFEKKSLTFINNDWSTQIVTCGREFQHFSQEEPLPNPENRGH